MPPTSNKRKRGAPRGNQNARKFGLFANSFTPAEIHALEHEEIGELKDDVNLINITIRRVVESSEFPKMTPDQKLSALRALTNALARKESILRTQHLLYNNQTTMQQILDELASLPMEQD